jgi:carboxyl-terminal processing protease
VPRIAATAAALACAAHAAAMATQAAEPSAPGPPARPASPDDAYRWFDPIIDLRALVAGSFVDDPDAAAMQRAAMAAMVAALNDPYSTYLGPEEERWLRTQVSGTYVGIGVELDLRDGVPTVITAIDDSPAMEAGILPGDELLEVDGRPTEGIGAAGLEQLLPGQPGSVAKIRLRRPDGTERTVDVPRRTVETRSVKGLLRDQDGWRHALDPDRRIAYVRIARFTERTLAELDAALAALRADGLSGLVLDLRGNGGGSLDAAVGTVDRFLSDGAIVSTRGRGTRGRTWDATPSRDDVVLPVVVLVNQGSASASEVVAGALRDHGRAKVIGTRTYGKGSVQEIVPLPDGAGTVRLTTARYYLPSGKTVSREAGSPKWGVEPDTGFHVAMAEADLVASNALRQARESGAAPKAGTPAVRWNDPGSIRADARDPQLAAGLEAMQGYLDVIEWPVVGDLSGDVGAANDELRASLEHRRRLVEELKRTDAAISGLRATGAGVDDPQLAEDASLIDAEVELRDREGRVVGRWIVKDPKQVREGLGTGAQPAAATPAPPPAAEAPADPAAPEGK